MSVKDDLITLFENDRGSYLSGEELADRLGCSRAAVWKAVNALRAEGYSIRAITNRGYCLAPDTDVLSVAGIERYLGSDLGSLQLNVYKEVSSTNDLLRALAERSAAEGTVMISGMQTAGKGRRGRSFFSPSDTGLYMSILLRPDMPAADAVRMTAAAAVAVAEAIEEVSGRNADIKWVNDVYMSGKKVCGILTEAAFSLESGGFDYAVVGIGINAYEPRGGFPDEIKDIAGAVCPNRQEDLRNHLAAEVLRRFMDCYRDLSSHSMLDSYRSRLMWVGERIKAVSGSKEFECTMLGVDENYGLKVRMDDRSERIVSSGEITIRRT